MRTVTHFDPSQLPTLPGSSDTTYQEPLAKSEPDSSPRSVPKVSAVIPTLNEAKNLRHVLPYIPDWVYEIIIVDGHSTDGTVDTAYRMRNNIRVVSEEKRGKGNALLAGFAAARGDIIVMLDADGSMDPREFTTYVGALIAGADYVKGSRFIQGGGTSDMTFIRKLGNWGLTMAVRVLIGGIYTDLCYGYNAFWKYTLPLLHLDGGGFEIETLMNIRALRAGLRIEEVPSYEADRVYGTSNLRAIHDGLRVLKTIFREWINVQQEHRQSKKQRTSKLLAPEDTQVHNRTVPTEQA